MVREHTTPSTTTGEAEAEAAVAAHDADRGPTPEEERLAEENTLDKDVAEAYQEATETGATLRGEGRIA